LWGRPSPKVPPFWQEPNDPRALGRDVGFFEVMSCVAPAAPAAMAGYYLGASNDGGISSSPAQLDAAGAKPAPTATYKEYAGVFSGAASSSVALPTALRAAMGDAFTISAWVKPDVGATGAGFILNVGGVGVGFAVDANGGEVRINRSTYQVKPFYLSSETVLPIK
jgi:hypothetical protein